MRPRHAEPFARQPSHVRRGPGPARRVPGECGGCGSLAVFAQLCDDSSGDQPVHRAALRRQTFQEQVIAPRPVDVEGLADDADFAETAAFQHRAGGRVVGQDGGLDAVHAQRRGMVACQGQCGGGDDSSPLRRMHPVPRPARGHGEGPDGTERDLAGETAVALDGRGGGVAIRFRRARPRSIARKARGELARSQSSGPVGSTARRISRSASRAARHSSESERRMGRSRTIPARVTNRCERISMT